MRVFLLSSKLTLTVTTFCMPIRFRSYINRETLISTRNLLTSIYTTLSSLLSKMNPTKQNNNNDTPFDPTEPSIPISFPIKTLQDLESKSYLDSFHFPFNKSSVSLPSTHISLPDRPRILVCHDMAGGYTDDKWVQGGNNPDAYAIWHWYLMDVFVYFSHNLVTLPPPCWVNTAHNHGVKVLGTFITEWDEGKVIASILLSTKESAQMYAERLTELAVALGFDGWLINMEVKLDIGEIPMMKEFVSHLTQTMHASVPGSLVIWYDSVTIDGKLNWQDQLNDSNKPFFDICDGIFVNYTWKADYPKLSAVVAGDRKFDVYMGIDVFGRGTYGGGQWTTNVALDVIKKADVSAAIFAPGWVYETEQPPDFQTAQNRWWSLVEKSWGILQNYPKVLPFFSNFDQGHGYHFNIDGKKVSDAPWNNISCQSFQPFLELSGDHTPNAIQVFVDFEGASYNGGGNITFKGSLEDNAYFMTRLFQGELILGNLPVHFKYSVKSDGSSMVGLSLELISPTNSKTSVLLSSWGNALITMNRFSNKFSSVIMPRRVTELETAPGWVMQESSISMNGYTLTGIHAMCYKSIPEVNKPKLDSGSHGQSAYYAVLGHITVKTDAQDSVFPLSTAWIVESRHIKWTSGSQGSNSLSVKIIWTCKDENAPVFTKYNIYVEKQTNKTVDKPSGMLERTTEYLGVAQVEAFYVSDLVVPFGTSSLKFIIQVCGLDGACQRLEESPFFQLSVEGNDGLNEARMTSSLPSTNSAWSLAFLGHNAVIDTKGNELPCVVYISPVKKIGFKHHKKATESLTDLRSTSCFIYCIVFWDIYQIAPQIFFNTHLVQAFLFCLKKSFATYFGNGVSLARISKNKRILSS